MVYRRPADLDFALADLPTLPRPRRVLMTTPEHFNVEYVINPHMADKAGTVDKEEAKRQWEALRAAYKEIGVEPVVVEGQPGLPDMVFCANQTLPFYQPESGERGVVLSRMHAKERKGEVAHFARFFREEGYAVEELPEGLDTDFEGMGDALWHAGRALLWGGHGFRTHPDAYEHLSTLLGVPVLLLRLADDDFYHLDTCLSILDEKSALIYPGAFDEDGLALLRHFFEQLVEAPEGEARRRFACNAHCPDGEHVLIQEGCEVTSERLSEAGFTPVELDTGEFLKSGGSVFCMKLMMW